MTPVDLEAFLVRLYVDDEARRRFLADPAAEARRSGFSEAELPGIIGLDRVGLELAAHSFARKRELQQGARRPRSAWTRLQRLVGWR